MYTVTFNSFDLSDYMKVLSVKRSVLPARSPELKEIAGKKGAHLTQINTGVKNFEVKGYVKGINIDVLQVKMENLASVLNVDEEKVFTISDTPNKYWLATPVEQSEIDDLGTKAYVTINFLAPDPVAIGELKNGTLLTNGTTIVENDSNESTFPRVRVEFTQDANHFAMVSPDGILMVGNPLGYDQQPVKPEELILHDPMNDLTPWATTGTTIDYGSQDGQFVLQQGGNVVGVLDYGDETTGNYKGPAMIRSVPLTQDFRVEAVLEFDKATVEETGRTEITLFDEAGNQIGTMVLWDNYPSSDLTTGHIYAGTMLDKRKIIDSKGKYTGAWNKFLGVVKLKRVGDEWHAAITQVIPNTNPLRYEYSTHVYEHIKLPPNTYQGRLGSIQVHMSKHIDSPRPVTHTVQDIKVYQINEQIPTEDEVKTVFKAGDVLELDFETGTAYRNGQNFMDLVDAGSRWFSIPPGTTEIGTRTEDGGAIITFDYNERWLA